MSLTRSSSFSSHSASFCQFTGAHIASTFQFYVKDYLISLFTFTVFTFWFLMMSESDSVLSFNESYSYKFEDNLVISTIVQFWCSLNFQQKLLVVLLFWLLVNLLMIRIAWRAYGHRLSEILTKGLFIRLQKWN